LIPAVDAIKADDVAKLQQALDGLSRDDINAISEDIDSVGLLHIACSHHNLNTDVIVSLLIGKLFKIIG
jgi:hypothetical protein